MTPEAVIIIQMCPACGETLVTFELEGIEIDQCQKCGGIWLDSGEIDEILGRAGGSVRELSDAVKAADEPAQEKRKCVRCRAGLKAVTFRGVALDRCPYGHGVWFDKGELAEIVKADTGEVAGFLKELFKAELKGA
jgi:Zn-finger nucleic acid-binding protein